MVGVMKSIHTSQQPATVDGSTSSKLKQSLRAMSVTAISVCTTAVLIIVFFVAWIFNGGFDGNWPDRAPGLILIEIVWVLIATCELFVTTYIVQTISNKLAARQAPTASGGRGPSGTTSPKSSLQAEAAGSRQVVAVAGQSGEQA
jgi:heme/copper-type cytochrome/quinol oxidase subunit 2